MIFQFAREGFLIQTHNKLGCCLIQAVNFLRFVCFYIMIHMQFVKNHIYLQTFKNPTCSQIIKVPKYWYSGRKKYLFDVLSMKLLSLVFCYDLTQNLISLFPSIFFKSYLYTNHQNSHILNFRHKNSCFDDSRHENFVLIFCNFFLETLIFPDFHENIRCLSSSIYSPRFILHLKMSVLNKQTNR